MQISQLRESAGCGLAIYHASGPTRLKWHRLRRRMRDPLFSAETLAKGFTLGASMELDLRVREDGGFAVLHDAEIGRETNGNGLVRRMTRADLAGVSYYDGVRPLILSEDLAELMSASHPQSIIQFDMKDDLAAVGLKGVDHLARYFSNSSAQIIVSGDCPDLITEIGRRLPSVMRGIDPTDRLLDCYRTGGIGAVETALLAELRGPTDPHTVYLAWQLVLQAQLDGLNLVALCQSEGRQVDAWTFTPAIPDEGLSAKEADDLAKLMSLGPDQITTDECLVLEARWNSISRGP